MSISNGNGYPYSPLLSPILPFHPLRGRHLAHLAHFDGRLWQLELLAVTFMHSALTRKITPLPPYSTPTPGFLHTTSHVSQPLYLFKSTSISFFSSVFLLIACLFPICPPFPILLYLPHNFIYSRHPTLLSSSLKSVPFTHTF